ncbi:hypothetical protein QF030_005385 [Streptomyces rishiriensis]|uniref:DUF234 domain-containing protein n=1 Tax=Streptomyces rishiriensis TaxID=68264 RepID=A0ABU0NVP4_STRRH|nr:hypothetical protein [Streptomyces rishiriensis]
MLAAIGSGERTFTNIARAAGGVGATPLQRALELLTGKRIVAGELPVSLRPSKDRRYRVTDPYLRFWLHLLGPSMEEIERGRGDLTLARIRENWTSWRGRAIEPLIREALARILPDGQLPAAPLWAATGPAPTTLKSTSSGRTVPPLPRNRSSWAPSSGWSSRPSTGTIWQLFIDTEPLSPTNPFQSWRSRGAALTLRASTPPTAPAICSLPGRCEWWIAGDAREWVGTIRPDAFPQVRGLWWSSASRVAVRKVMRRAIRRADRSGGVALREPGPSCVPVLLLPLRRCRPVSHAGPGPGTRVGSAGRLARGSSAGRSAREVTASGRAVRQWRDPDDPPGGFRAVIGVGAMALSGRPGAR